MTDSRLICNDRETARDKSVPHGMGIVQVGSGLLPRAKVRPMPSGGNGPDRLGPPCRPPKRGN